MATACAAVALAGCSSAETQRVKQAVADWTHAYAKRDVKTFCRKTIVATDLPRSLAGKMHLPWGEPGTTAGWDREYRDCVNSFGKHGEFDQKLGVWEVKG